MMNMRDTMQPGDCLWAWPVGVDSSQAMPAIVVRKGQDMAMAYVDTGDEWIAVPAMPSEWLKLGQRFAFSIDKPEGVILRQVRVGK